MVSAIALLTEKYRYTYIDGAMTAADEANNTARRCEVPFLDWHASPRFLEDARRKGIGRDMGRDGHTARA